MELYQLCCLKKTVNINLDICVVIIGLSTVYLKYAAVGEICVSTASDTTVSKANIFTSGCLFNPVSYSQSASIYNLPVEWQVSVK
jgi:hypothetical protein